MGIAVFGAVFVDIKGYPSAQYIPGGRNAGRVVHVHGGVSRNVAEDIANIELRPSFISVVDDTGEFGMAGGLTISREGKHVGMLLVVVHLDELLFQSFRHLLPRRMG